MHQKTEEVILLNSSRHEARSKQPSVLIPVGTFTPTFAERERATKSRGIKEDEDEEEVGQSGQKIPCSTVQGMPSYLYESDRRDGFFFSHVNPSAKMIQCAERWRAGDPERRVTDSWMC